MGYGGRCRHVELGSETSGGGWWVTSVGDVQIDGVLLRERRWKSGVTETCYDNKWLLMGER